MIINSANLKTLTTAFNGAFKTGFGGIESQYAKIAMDTTSTTSEEIYPWLGEFPRMREWVGDRVIQNLAAHSWTIKNKDFELTVEVDRNAIEDDRFGVYSPMFQEMGRETAEQPDKLVFGMLSQGFSSVCYDGQYFFDTDHPVKNELGQTQSVSNFVAGAGPAWYLLDTSRAMRAVVYQTRRSYSMVPKDKPEDDNVFHKKTFLYGVDGRSNAGFGLWQLAYASKGPLDPDTYEAARTAMKAVRGDGGRKLGINPTVLLVPDELEGDGRRVLKAALVDGGDSNVWADSAELIVSPWL